MSRNVTTYAVTDPAAHVGRRLFVCARPIYGDHIGYAGRTGFKIYSVVADNSSHIEEARAMDAKEIFPVAANTFAAICDKKIAGSEYAEQYAELLADDPTMRPEVLRDMGIMTVTITQRDTEGASS